MSRLNSAIRRLEAQRACLDWACNEIRSSTGLVLELGLGNGRTFDHLKQQLPDRPIFVFDREFAAHPNSTPPPEQFFRGEITQTLPRFLASSGKPIVLAHLDLGSGDTEQTRANLTGISSIVLPSLAVGGLVLSDQALSEAADHPDHQVVSLPLGIKPNRYFIYRKAR